MIIVEAQREYNIIQNIVSIYNILCVYTVLYTLIYIVPDK